MAATVLSLFSGYGGLDLGLHAAVPGARVLGYVEREAYPASVLLARMEVQALEPAPVFVGSIEDADFRPFQGVGWVTGGFPCQPFSAAGKRQGQDDERWLWDDIVRVVREVQPRWCLFENVPGLVRLGLGPVLRDLAVLGFDVEWGRFSAEGVGASHRRERIFILARRRDGVVNAGGELADAERSGGEPSPWRETGRPRHAEGGATPEHNSDTVAGGRRELLGGGRDEGHGTGRPAGRPLFAPGPTDLDVWARVLAETPEVEPSLCRMADGTSDWLDFRQDRLRAIGNGVVPLQAATAVRVLAARAGWKLT